ncbi:MAG: GNAT family N-acetyltransferase [Thermoleophilia bacterium]
MVFPTIRKVADSAEIEAVAALAYEIWNQHFVPIIGQAQVDYMLDKFQSATAIAGQISGGYMYYTIEEGDQTVGYFALAPVPDRNHEVQLSKIYVRVEHQGSGLGRSALEFVEELCEQMGVRKLWLTVNRQNSATIDFYRRMGFTIEGEVVQGIGSGFVMDDYRMFKTIA